VRGERLEVYACMEQFWCIVNLHDLWSNCPPCIWHVEK